MGGGGAGAGDQEGGLSMTPENHHVGVNPPMRMFVWRENIAGSCMTSGFFLCFWLSRLRFLGIAKAVSIFETIFNSARGRAVRVFLS